MILAHIAGVPVQESLAYVLPVVVVVGFIYWSGFRERRRGARADSERPREPASDEPSPPAGRPMRRLP